jgi:hypothetical protein
MQFAQGSPAMKKVEIIKSEMEKQASDFKSFQTGRALIHFFTSSHDRAE